VLGELQLHGVGGDVAAHTLHGIEPSRCTTPGRTTRSEIRNSHASPNSNFGESCSIARVNRSFPQWTEGPLSRG
jgi:hypothetical protein